MDRTLTSVPGSRALRVSRVWHALLAEWAGGLRTPAQRLRLVVGLQRKQLAEHQWQLLPYEARHFLACAEPNGFLAGIPAVRAPILAVQCRTVLEQVSWLRHRQGRCCLCFACVEQAKDFPCYTCTAMLKYQFCKPA